MKRILFYAISLFLLNGCKNDAVYFYNSGAIYGTYYHITYESPEGQDFQEAVDLKLAEYNLLFSPFDENSVISKINNNVDVTVDSVFLKCFDKAMEVSRMTDGAFDITIAPLANAWGFGFKNKRKLSEESIDSLVEITGYEKIKYENGKFIKTDLRIMISMSAIAKGYICDLMGDFLRSKGCRNYLVDIGGEVVARGVNAKGRPWRIEIRKPDESASAFDSQRQGIVNLHNKAIATSGNYLNFYIEDGKKYAHTIDPRMGYPVQYSLLSASVIADDCMTADAYATAFMVLGIEKSVELSRIIPGVDVYFVYEDESGDRKVYMSAEIKKYLD